jgi:hypothetical protein
MTPLIFSQPQIPPSKEFAKKTKEPPPPWISSYCASMVVSPKSILTLKRFNVNPKSSHFFVRRSKTIMSKV